MGKTLSLKEIFELEPRLKEIEKDILAVDGSTKDFCANREWFSFVGEPPRFKQRMNRLVGFMSKNEALTSSTAYNTVYRHLYGLLSDCKHCACW